jgi:serine/threonine protein phosphatase PrpC
LLRPVAGDRCFALGLRLRGTILRIDAGGHSDQGRVRQNNEDAYKIEPALDLFVLSDGMGGVAHGELASALAVETIVSHCEEAENNRTTPLFWEPRPDLCERTNRLGSAVTLANRKIYDDAAIHEDLRGMGATIVAAWLSNQRLSLVHVGDSRAYLLRSGSLEQLTADHSLVAEHVRRGIMTPQEAENSQMQSVLVKALGIDAQVEPDADERMLLDGDVLLLCSDGLTRMVTDPEIASTLVTVEPAQAAADRLVQLANEYGGEDNVTAIVVRFTAGSGGLFARIKRWTKHSSKGA